MARVIMPLLISATSAAYPVIMYAKSPAPTKTRPTKDTKGPVIRAFCGEVIDLAQ